MESVDQKQGVLDLVSNVRGSEVVDEPLKIRGDRETSPCLFLIEHFIEAAWLKFRVELQIRLLNREWVT